MRELRPGRSEAARVAALLGTLMVAGCATNVPQNVSVNPGSSASVEVRYLAPPARKSGLYALVERAAAGSPWQLRAIAEQPQPRTSTQQEWLFVTLDGRQVSPAYEQMVNPQAPFNCALIQKAPPELAYEPCGVTALSRVNASATAARNVVSAVVTLGLASGSNREVDVAAVTDVLRDTGLMDGLARLSAAQARLNKQSSDYEAARRRSVDAAVKSLTLRLRVEDDSGLLPAGQSPQPLLDRVQRRAVAAPVSVSPLPAIGSVDERVAALQAQADAWARAREALPVQTRVTLGCGASKWRQFDITLRCPADIPPGTQDVEIVAAVSQYDAPAVRPRLELKDKQLTARTDERGLWWSNQTDAYLEVREVSCYVQSEVITRKLTPAEYIPLAPRSDSRQPENWSDFCGSAAGERLKPGLVTAQQLAGKSLRFGLAVKYRKSGDATDRTLFQPQRSYPLLDLVKATM